MDSCGGWHVLAEGLKIFYCVEGNQANLGLLKKAESKHRRDDRDLFPNVQVAILRPSETL